MRCQSKRSILSLFLTLLAVTCSASSASQTSWSKYLKQHHPNKKTGFPLLLCVVEETQAASLLPIFATSVLALPGRWEKSLTVVATSPSAKAICDRIHSSCFLEEHVFSHERVNFTGSRAFKSQPSYSPAKSTKVKRTAETLQIAWGKVYYAELTVALGYDVLTLDVDMVLLRPFMKQLQGSLADMLYSEDVPGAPNVGFMLYRANAQTLRFLQIWQEERFDPQSVEQYHFPAAVKLAQAEMPHFTVKALDIAQFPGGCGVNSKKWWCCDSSFPKNTPAAVRSHWAIFHATCVYGEKRGAKLAILRRVLAVCMPS
ncbi:hypothetical protein WJX74_003357 [Apatococcus lobatus]|uniref:Nucleotide-diphospho-sugar transferase domain-containing protein n=2 Tax=Apatococcus TaxID=904362 RepID=A0AAW1SSB6_9CHLO